MFCVFNCQDILGYQPEDVASKFGKFMEPRDTNNIDGLTDNMSKLNRVSDTIFSFLLFRFCFCEILLHRENH